MSFYRIECRYQGSENAMVRGALSSASRGIDFFTNAKARGKCG
jgi:hypothetical protein